MKKETIMVGVIGLLVGVVITGFTAGQAVNNNNTGMMQMMGMNTTKTQQQGMMKENSGMSMDDMNTQLETKSGDDFDKAFLDMMIVHHQGAIDMADLAATRANHEEVKTLSKAIIIAQNKEIADMQQWQMDWGYKSTNDIMPGMHH